MTNSLLAVVVWLNINDPLRNKRDIFYRNDFTGCYFINDGIVEEKILEQFDTLLNDIDVACETLRENSEKKNAFLDLRKKINNKKKGFIGENDVAMSLRHCEGDMCILRNLSLRLEKDKKDKAEVDFVVITHKNIYVIESKNWNSDVLFDDKGQFQIRKESQMSYEPSSGRSPIDQNLRHMKVVKEILKKYSSNFAYMDEIFQSLVVFTNLKRNVAMNNIDGDDSLYNQVIRLDSLIWEIQKREKNSPYRFSNEDMLSYASVIYAYSMETCNEKANKEYTEFCTKYNTLINEKLSI